MIFKLSEKEIEARDLFYKACKKKTNGKDVRLSYCFHPTGIGTTVKVISETLGVEKDITDLSCW